MTNKINYSKLRKDLVFSKRRQYSMNEMVDVEFFNNRNDRIISNLKSSHQQKIENSKVNLKEIMIKTV